MDDAPDALREQSCVFNLFDEVDDGDCVKEQVGDNGSEELGVFEKDIQSREEECKSGDQQRLHDDQNWQQEDFGRWQAEPVVDERVACVENNEQWDGHDAEGQEEMPEVGKRRCDWQQLAREVDLADKRHLFGDAVCSIQYAGQKIGPREERGEHVDAVVWDFDRDDVLEDEQQDDCPHDWVCERPCDTEDGIFVADIQLAANQGSKELTVAPCFPDFSREGTGWLCHSRSLVVQPGGLEEFEELFAFDENLALSRDAVGQKLTLADVRADA